MRVNQPIHSKNTPLIRVFAPLIAGELTDMSLEIPRVFWMIILAITIIILITCLRLPLNWKWKLNKLIGFCTLLLIFSFGGMVHTVKKPVPRFDLKKLETIHLFKIKKTTNQSTSRKKYVAEVYTTQQGYEYIADSYIYLNNTSLELMIGDIFISNSLPVIIKKTGNPGGYDFNKEASKKGIFFTTNINDESSFYIIGKENNLINTKITETQNWIFETLKNNLKDKKNYGLAEAVLIGYRSDLDPTIVGSYINTGVVHVIAISGLHIGLIFTIMSAFINMITGPKNAKWISIFITMPTIWWFTMLTGSTPSVMRSALMSSFTIIGNATGKKPVTMNTLLSAGFIQVMEYPNVLSDLGFQLSYLAVASIIMFNPLIKKMLYIKNPIIKEGWDMVCITVSAQFLTTPLSIFKFHQFPLLFLLTNIVAVPLSSLLVLLELLLCIFNLVHVNTEYISLIINGLINTMNSYIGSIETVPFSMLTDIFIGIPTLITIYLIVFKCWCWMNKPSPRALIHIISLATIVSITHHAQKILANQDRLVVLNVPGQTCILKQEGNRGLLIANERLLKNNKMINTIKKQLINYYWLDSIEFKSMPNSPLIIEIDQITEEGKKEDKKSILITGNPTLQIEQLTNFNDSSTMIIPDASNKLWKIQQWEKEADKLLLRFHALAEKGPIIIEPKHNVFSALKFN